MWNGMDKMRAGNSRNNVSGKLNKVTANGSNVTETAWTAVGYVRVSTDMQAVDGLSLDAQRHAIQSYCSMQGLRLIKICQGVESGGKATRPGLADALAVRADVVVVLKFERVSRSLRHFCELYEEHFADGAKELVAIRESIRLDSVLGRALVSILMVFAQMEREATGERTREAISHIRRCGYHFGKTPYGFKTVPAADNPRFRVKVWHISQPVNSRNHSDVEVKVRVRELRDRGTSYAAIARILNEIGYVPYKGKRFTESSVRKLLGNTPESKLLTPRAFCESIIRRAEGTRPSYPVLARLLTDGKFVTPRGNTHWWPAQVQQLLNGVYDAHYRGVGAPT
jgi:DNA invertase Pin-like site-specific DNA recombinase